ncbi:exodeoxyribonuclease I [Pseudomonas syringae pv. actinidiae]|nr:exodeoxyribonuclease I [Pseudomonas syringae pv. actinidiae]
MMHFYDFETADANPSTPILQFASVSTDHDLNVIKGSETNLIAKPSRHALPAPIAFMIHMLDLEHLKEHGLSERALVQHVVNIFLHSPNSQMAGYNTLSFDDKVLQHACFRNMLPPYDHQFMNGNTRFDVFKLVQLMFAFRPESLEFPKKEDGSFSLKLEQLSAANGIVHERAHDALSDVYATIGLARIIKGAEEKLYRFAQSMTVKQNAQDLILQGVPLLHVNFKYQQENRNTSLVHPLCVDASNKNKYIIANLREDPYNMLNMSPQELRHFMFTKREELAEDAPRVGVSQVGINDMPLIVPAKNMLTPALATSMNLDVDQCMRNLEMIRQTVGFQSRIQEAYAYESKTPIHVFDTLYSGGFIDSKVDAPIRKEMSLKTDDELSQVDAVSVANRSKDKTRMLELLVALKPEPGNLIEKALLHRQLKTQFFDVESRQSFDSFYKAVSAVRMEKELSPEQEVVMEQVIAHVEGLRDKFLILQNEVVEKFPELEKEIAERKLHWLKPYINQQYGNGIIAVHVPEAVAKRQEAKSDGPGMG